MLFVKIKTYQSEEEVIIACDQLTRQGILSFYGRSDNCFQIKVKAHERDTAINLIENSSTMRNFYYYRDKEVEDN